MRDEGSITDNIKSATSSVKMTESTVEVALARGMVIMQRKVDGKYISDNPPN